MRVRSGFALIDLLISLSIIGILMVVAGSSYRAHIDRAGLAGCIDRIRDLRRAAVEYKSHNDLALYASSAQFWQTYNRGQQDPEYVYCSNNEGARGVTGLVRDGTPTRGGATAFAIACTHNHGRAAAYVFAGSVIPNAIIVATVAGNVTSPVDCASILSDGAPGSPGETGRSGFGDGTNPGEGADHAESGNDGTNNPNQSTR
ncbi:MAG: type II secretion system protein [Deltaproteobacteria bacterium]|nr:type II secretion system protein [Deltaproteobacteria bacterium]